MRFNLVNHIIKKIAVPDSKLPINGNEYLGPVRSNVNYNYRPAQVLKMEKQKFSHNTDEMQHYIPKENGGI